MGVSDCKRSLGERNAYPYYTARFRGNLAMINSLPIKVVSYKDTLMLHLMEITLEFQNGFEE